MSQYFGQLNNQEIQEINVKTEKNIFNHAIIIDINGKRFFYKKSDVPMELSINIRAYKSFNPKSKSFTETVSFKEGIY